MKYISTAEENTTWIILSSVWALGGVCTWICALNSPPIGLSGSQVTVLALLVVAIGVSLRLPILSSLPRTSPRLDHVALLLGYVSTANWLGYLLLRSNHFMDAVPALLIFGFSELWLSAQYSTFSRGFVSPFGNQLASELLPESNDYAGEPQEQTADLHELNEHVSRIATEGIDEEGRRFCSGKLRAKFDSGQTSQEVVIGFCPAFSGDPDVDFEVDSEACNSDSGGKADNGQPVSVRLVHCTPSGMRLALRRSEVHEPQSVVLHWYAVAVSQADQRPQRVLP